MAGEVCGAVSGAVLSIGLLYGEEEPEAAAHLTEEFMRRSAERNGAVRCIDIIGFNIGDASTGFELSSVKGILQFGLRGGKRVCNGVVRNTVEALLETLNDWEN
jgi:C_GCAxxG_C_C family probable redox protein